MPYRKEPLETDSIYHIYNRGFKKQNIFLDNRDYLRAVKSLDLYRHLVNIKYSYFNFQGKKYQKKIKLKQPALVELLAYCFMPNHFHLLIKQILDGGIQTVLGKFTNSYAKYFNTKRNRIGPVFEGRFKAVLVESNEQLTHLSRYIHLNPFSAALIKKEQLLTYPYSSISDYLKKRKNSIVNSSMILEQFKSSASHRNFVLDNADYQLYLQRIKKQLLDSND